ncbi:CBM35 domain-containing protein [Mesorhizobium sp. CAU 1741]|uniref:carbohydrate-binding protein n=1 Tax=Mesorhizobium sp. CAU 1741 TaxID=3140366 RepID=UPI00325B7115
MASIQGIYVALFGRPADPAGLEFFNDLTNEGADLTPIIGALTATDEFVARFDGMSDAAVINAIYLSLYGRDADAGGLAFFLAELQAGRQTIETIAINILDGAQGDDRVTLQNKLDAANMFTAQLDMDTEVDAYAGDFAIQVGQEFLESVGFGASTRATVASTDDAILRLFPDEGQEPGDGGTPGDGGGDGEPPVNQPPTSVMLTAVTVAENDAGAVVANIVIVDPDSTYTAANITVSNPAIYRVIMGEGGLQLALQEGVSLDFEASVQPSVTITAGGVTSAAFAPTPSDDESDNGPVDPEAPTNIVLSGATVAENDAAAIAGTLSATDPDGNSAAIVFSTTDERFVIDGTTLRLADGISLNHEVDANVSVSIVATDEDGVSTTSSVTIAVSDVNEAPVLIAGADVDDVTLTEGSGQTIDLAAALGATDPDDGDTVIYEATLAGGAALPAGITLDGTDLVVGNTVAAGTYQISVLATDGELDSESVSFTVEIEEEDEPVDQPPTSVTLTAVAVAENVAGAVVATIAIVDGDSTYTAADITVSDPATYRVIMGEGGLQLALQENVLLDFEADDQPSVTITAGGVTSAAFVPTPSDDSSDNPVGPYVFEVQGEEFLITDTEATPDTVYRVPGANTDEPGANAGNSGPGLTYDAFGLRPGYEGQGYLDMGGEVGDAGSFAVTPPAAGTYQMTVRYANGGTSDRPMTVTVNGVVQTIDFESTIPTGGTADAGWANWTDVTIDVVLQDGQNTVSFANTITSGPNIDVVTISGDGAEPPVNQAPVLAASAEIDDVTVSEGTAQTISIAAALSATDPDGDTVSYEAALTNGNPLPAGITFDGTNLVIGDTVAIGTYQISVLATDGELDSESVDFTVTVQEDDAPVPFNPLVIQAETGTIALAQAPDANRTQVRDASNPEAGNFNGLRPDFSGTGYLDFGNDGGDTATYTVSVAEAGTYDLNIRYASNDLRPLNLAVNGTVVATPDFTSTDTNAAGVAPEGFDVWDFLTVPITLQAGSNTFSFAIPAGATKGPNFDRFEITEAGTGPIVVDTSADADGNLALVAPASAVDVDDAAAITLTVSGVDADIVKVEISLDGGTTRVDITDLIGDDGTYVFDGSALPEGTTTVTLIVTDDADNEAQATDTVTIVDGEEPVTVDPFTIQAEDLSLVTVSDTTPTGTTGSPTRVVDAQNFDPFGNYRAGAVGGGYMDFGAEPGDAISISVDAPAAGTYLVTFRYGNGAADSRSLALTLNGDAVTTLPFARGPGTGDAAWNNWVEQTVELELVEGQNTIGLAIPAGNVGGPNIDQISFAYLDGNNPVQPFSLTIEGETFTPDDTTSAVARVPGTPEASIPAGGDTNGDGLWDGFTGTGYLDMGGQVDDGASFDLDVPADGLYTISFRYSNGGGGGNGDRPMQLTINGEVSDVDMSFPGTNVDGWNNWQQTVELEVELTAGSNTIRIANTVANGPNIDSVTISRDDVPVDPEEPSEPGPREEIKINFQDGTVSKAPGYLVANFVGYGDRGNGLSYGFVTQASAIDADGSTATPINGASYPAIAINERSGQGESSNVDDGRNFDSYDPRLTGYAHFDLGGTFPAGEANRVAFEVGLENGWYEVTAAVGDTGGSNDSNNQLVIEGTLASSYTPTNFYKTELTTVLVEVQDGHLTLAAPNGSITEIQYLDIRALPDLTPDDNREAPEDYASFTNPMAIGGIGEDTVTVDLDPASGAVIDVDPTSDLILGIQVAPGRGGALLESLTDGSIKLYETLTGDEVGFSVNTTAGFDSLTISPTGGLEEFTSYTLLIDGFRDRGSNADLDAPTREFQKFSTTFTTTAQPEVEAREVAFVETIEINGAADDASLFTTIEMSPDGQYLYVGTLDGQIKRWDVSAQDGSLSNEQSISLPYFRDGNDARGIIGFVFDPNDSNTIWVTDNYKVPLDGRDNGVPDFSGRVSKVTIGDGPNLTATAEAYITGLPRSNGDHVTNSLEFRENPDAGIDGAPSHLLYLIQGSNSAMGQADSAWGFRPERLLNAAILEIDPTRDAPQGGFDVSTEPLPDNNANRRFGYDFVNGQYAPTDDGNLKNGGIAINSGEFAGNFLHFDANGVASVRDGELASSALVEDFYNPYAEDAVLKIFATGQRNGYDLVWHSNGNLYVSANGSAAGGNVPDDPNTTANEGRNNVGTQHDYFFRIEEGKYSGHPNPLRGEFILNGGNPTSGNDPNQVGEYAVGTQPDPDYDVDAAFSLGFNRSPNGAIEYKSNVFGSGLQNAVLFTEYSSGNDLRAMILDDEGNVVDNFIIRDPNGNVISHPDPLDVIEGADGRLYLMTLNRSNGQSQIVRLDPAPGGIVVDNTADAGGDLAIVVVDGSDPAATLFQVNGLDDDIVSLTVTFDGGTTQQTVTLNGQDRFTTDVSTFGSPVTAVLTVTDAVGNTATDDVAFVPGEAPTELISLIVIQAEDRTPADGTSVTTPNDVDSQIEIRDEDAPETGSGAGYVNGLRPGAFGIDGNTDNLDGTPGGYADFGSSNADFITFNFEVPSGSAGASVLRLRYSNGGDVSRPLQIEVNGTIVQASQAFAPTATPTVTDGWTVWSTVDIPANLVTGSNQVTLRSIANTGPNIDQLEVFVAPGGVGPNDGEEVVDGITYVVYEAENASFTGDPAVVSEDRTQSGDFVDFIGPDTETITWTVDVEEAGSYALDILYSLGTNKTARPMTLTLNGQSAQTLAFTPNSNTAETEWGPQSALVDLLAGENTITISAPGGVGPNVDYLRLSKEPISVFEPDYADITGAGRIELEAQDGSTNTVNGSTVDFYFTVGTTGFYKLDVAANAGATNGQGLTWFLNGAEIDESDFPGTGEAGEESVYIQLTAGEEYQLRVVSDAPGANGIDYLDLSPINGNANADISIDSLDPTFLNDRLQFSYLEDPNGVGAGDRDFKDSGTVRISNTGTEPLEVIEAELSGPFKLSNPDVFTGLTLAPGASIDVVVLFDREAYSPPTSNIDGTSTIFRGDLEIRTNDADTPVVTVDLAGFWQARDEGNQEPNVNEVWNVFGFGNVIPGLTTLGGGQNSVLSTNDVFAKTDPNEVLSPYWKIAEGFTEAKITQIAAFHSPGGATIGIHQPKTFADTGTPIQNQGLGQNINFWNHEGTDNQQLLPNGANGTSFATRTFTNADITDSWLGNEIFGISVAGQSTDPRLNPRGDVVVAGAQQGHTVKIFQALDGDGNVIPNVFLGIMDYTGINYDYNDNLFVIEGVAPVGFGQSMVVGGLDDAAADDRLVFTSIDTPANAQQSVRDEAVVTISNDGFAALNIDGITIGNSSAFEIVGTIPTTIAAGGSAQITVRFTGNHTGTTAGAELFNSTLTIASEDLPLGNKVIQLAGLAQEFSENGSEPTVAQIVAAFGYGTDVAQAQIPGGGQVETVGDEVLMPYMQRLDGSRPVEVIQIAAFLQQNNVARLGFHGLESDQVTNLFAQDDQEYQTVSPSSLVAGTGSGSGVARGTINQNGPFGLFISVDGRPTYASWSDPEANKIDPNFGQLVGNDQGHLIRYFQALDSNGKVIEGTYIGIQDYPGAGNYDYNDHMFVVKNVQPYALSDEDDANGDGVNDALQTDTDGDLIVDFFDDDTVSGNRGDYVLGINFGGGAIANDPVLGVALVGQNDSRVALSGSINPGAGVDAPSNANGANATPGSAFATYEDGSDWTATISVPNGVYVVVLHTQETYWNAAGQRQFDVAVNGQQVITNLDPFAEAGGDEPIAVEVIVTVTNGQIAIDLSADIDNAALNAVTIYEYVEAGSGQQPVNGTPFLVDSDGVTIDALDYDNGGQGVAYNDNTAGIVQGASNGGRAGSDVEATSSGDVGWIDPGEWLEYTVNVGTAGEYDLDLLLANGGGAGRSAVVSFYRAGESQPYATTGAIANPQTASWTSFAERSVGGIELEAGEQIVRVAFSGGSQDFRSFSLTPASSAPQQMMSLAMLDSVGTPFSQFGIDDDIIQLPDGLDDDGPGFGGDGALGYDLLT